MATLPTNRLEHIGINAFDLEKMVKFYCDVFGYAVSDSGARFNGQKIVFMTKSPDEHHQFVIAEGRAPGSENHITNQISFNFGSIDELRTAYERYSELGLGDIFQVNHGNALSLYVKDPEGNTLELFADTPWHTPQPARAELDITKPTDVLLAETEAFCRSRPGFAARADWSADLAKRIGA